MAALHALQVQAQIVLDIVQRLLSNIGVVAEDYKDAVRKLKERGWSTKRRRGSSRQ